MPGKLKSKHLGASRWAVEELPALRGSSGVPDTARPERRRDGGCRQNCPPINPVSDVYGNDFTLLMDLGIKLNVTILSVNILDFHVAVTIISRSAGGGYRQKEVNIFLVELGLLSFCGSPASPESQVLESYVYSMYLF